MPSQQTHSAMGTAVPTNPIANKSLRLSEQLSRAGADQRPDGWLLHYPHVHLIMPAATVDVQRKQWGAKRGKAKEGYLFNHKALAKVFRAKILAAIETAGLPLPARYPKEWVVDCKSVGSGEPALIYLSRALFVPGRDSRERYRRLR
jgi:hypothetical protein